MTMEVEELPQKRNSRVAVGCTACRVRHVRCDKEMPSCSACIKAGIECERSLQVRFRPGLGNSAGYAFSSDQVWVRPRKLLEYRDETTRVSLNYEIEEVQELPMEEAMPFIPESTEADHPISNTPAHVSPASHISQPSHGSNSPATSRHELIESPGSARITRHLRDSSELYRSPASPYSRLALPFTTREAVLIRNFAENMALWADATDLKRHFELEVPRRSMYFPVLRYAVFAFSARHVNRDKSDTSTEALEYYDHCLSLLIEAVGESNGPIDEETLAAIAILRQYEEMDADDMEMHLTGTSRIVNSMSIFDFNGGLGEAAAWLCLRQDIYVSLTKQRPLRSDLETYTQSDVFRRVDDAAYANRMVFLLAKALSCVFPTDSSSSSGELESIRLEVDDWFDSKPAAFNPILENARNKEEGRLLPEIWVLSPFHAVGLQYYQIAKIVLAMSTPIATASVFEHIRQGKKVERTVRNHLLQIIALASSHARAENALFTARHSLSVWGSVFAEKEDQEMVLTFLDHVQQKTGWHTISLSSTLRQQWTQDAEEH
ncbi:Ff.00g085880.m01.CDS01 [Fusarium sp. VM40]|nr:Ff.00g085880.m01.CDS01 [Fusarium sp. VM40]